LKLLKAHAPCSKTITNEPLLLGRFFEVFVPTKRKRRKSGLPPRVILR